MEKKILRKIVFALINLMSFSVTTTGLLTDTKTWTFELKEITATSSDPEKLKVDLGIERVSRGVFAVSGEVLVNFDIVEGDSNRIQAKTYRSAHGDSDYKVLPFEIPNSHMLKFINTHYKNIAMKTLKNCSDLPVFEDKFVPPLEKKTYKLEACRFSDDGMPNHLQEGFYKVAIIGSGDVDYQIDIISEIVSDL